MPLPLRRVSGASASFVSTCHGRDGEGGQGEGQGPNLMNSWEVRRAKDPQLFSAVKNGVKGTLMPAFPLPDQQVWELVGFVRSLNAPANTVSLPGDPAAGEAVFFGKGGCAGCHMVRGRGGYLGPDLSNVGATRRVSELRAAILSPKELPSEGYRPLLVKTADGREIRAIAKHYSNWSIQALDEKENYICCAGLPWRPQRSRSRLGCLRTMGAA